MSQVLLAFVLTILIVTVSGCDKRKSGEFTLHILETGDVHGCWFDSVYVSNRTQASLFAVKAVADSVKAAVGEENVLMIDAGDCLQGNNAAYYFNYVDTLSPHLYPRLVKYAGYDVVTVGNHDIETGHAVYDRVFRELKEAGIPWLGGNAIRLDNGKSYFPEYAVVKKAGLKVLVLGYTNANIKGWLDESLWSGMTFESLLPFVQNGVDKVVRKIKPDVVVVSVHSGTGDGDGTVLESQAMDLYKSLRGVDVVIGSHDHRPITAANDSICMINSGAHCTNVAHAVVTIEKKRGRTVSKNLETSLIRVDKKKVDTDFRAAFQTEYEKVKEFSTREIGVLTMDLCTRDAYKGPCPYMNLIHKVQLEASGADISFAAPLTYNGIIRAGTLIYNDMFKVYPFENQLYVVNLTGEQIVNYLEYSYDKWIRTYDGEHVLRIENAPDPRTGAKSWSFVSRTYNFDSAAGLVYTVNVTLSKGQRVNVISLADGSPFDTMATYSVAMTSYRASGGGNLIIDGAGIPKEEIDSHIVGKLAEIRDYVTEYVGNHPTIDAVLLGDMVDIGYWTFVPQLVFEKAARKDMDLVFKK